MFHTKDIIHETNLLLVFSWNYLDDLFEVFEGNWMHARRECENLYIYIYILLQKKGSWQTKSLFGCLCESLRPMFMEKKGKTSQ